jgi:hypothetical protein
MKTTLAAAIEASAAEPLTLVDGELELQSDWMESVGRLVFRTVTTLAGA